MKDEVELNALPSAISCPDPLCTLTGYHAKHRHVRGCSCRSCIGRRSRRKGHAAQNKAFHAVGGTEAFRGQMTDEELWHGPPFAPGIRFEVKSGGSVPKWVVNAIQQVRNGRSEDVRPALIIKPKGTSQYWVLMRLEDLEAECRELMQAAVTSPELITDERVMEVQNKLHAMRALLDAAEARLCGRDR